MKQTSEGSGGRIAEFLGGQTIEPREFAYDFDAHHLAAIAIGPDAEGLVRRLARALGRDLLWFARGEQTAAWWGGGGEFGADDLSEISAAALRHEGRLAIGEPEVGQDGWRLSMRQAQAAHEFTAGREDAFVRYREVALAATVSEDHDLVAFLERTLISPLIGAGGKELPATLRAYLDEGGNLSSAGAALGLPRQTVADRILAIEERIGRSPSSCLAELDLALRLHGNHQPAARAATGLNRSPPDSARH